MSTDVDKVNMVKGKTENGNGQVDEWSFHCDGKGHIKTNCPRSRVTPTAHLCPTMSRSGPWSRQLESTKLVFAIADGGGLGSGTGAPEIVELMVDRGAAATTCLPFGAGVPMRQEFFLRRMVGASGHALRTYGVRELDFSVAAREVRVKFVLTDAVFPVLGVSKLTGRGFKVEFEQQARLVGMKGSIQQPTQPPNTRPNQPTPDPNHHPVFCVLLYIFFFKELAT